jgi:opacity protein-like surface antigen
MKQNLLILMLLFAAVAVKAQRVAMPDSTQALRPVVVLPMPESSGQAYKDTRYWQRHKVQNLAGGLSLGVGLSSLALCGLVYAVGSSESDGSSSVGTLGGIWIGASSALTLASIPLFVGAHKNKQKARAMAADGYETSGAAERDWRSTGLRYEVSGGVTWPVGQGALGDERLGWTAAVEARSYLGNSPLGLAVQLSVDDVRKQEQVYVTSGSITTMNTKMTDDIHVALSVILDYHFVKGGTFNPYVGAGVGFGLPASFLCQPRVGVELYRHHRIALSSHIGFGASDGDMWSKRLTDLRLTYGYTF